MKKKGIWVVVSVLVVLGLLLSGFGCAAPAPAPTPAPTPVEPIKLLFHNPWPPNIVLSDIEVWWLDEVEKKTEGRVTFDRVFGGTLGDLGSQPENLQARVFDVGQISYVYSPGLFPLGTVTTLPGIEDDSHVWGRSVHKLMKNPLLEAEYTALNQKYMFTWALEPMEVASHVPIYTLEDFEGLRIRVHGGSALAADKLGWTGVSVPWEELPVAGAEHVVDAAVIPVPITGRDAGLHTVFKYYITPFPIYQFHFATAINLDAWNSIPAGDQAIMLKAADDAVEYGLSYIDAKLEEGYADLAEAGVITIDWPASEMDRFRELAGVPVWADWVADRAAEGLPGQEALDAFQAILAQ